MKSSCSVPCIGHLPFLHDLNTYLCMLAQGGLYLQFQENVCNMLFHMVLCSQNVYGSL